MPDRSRSLPIHPILLAAYPVLALFANNLGEVSTGVFLRSLALSLGATLVLLLLARVGLRSWHRAAVLVSLLLLAFFAYGQVYDLKKSLPFLVDVMRHRFFAPLWLAATLAAIIAVLRARENRALTPILNIAAAAMLVMPLFQIGRYSLVASQEYRAAAGERLPVTALRAPEGKPLPSVYFLLLDTYMRSDALQRDMQYDNSAFVDKLKSLGFFVPNCSRSNYSYTQASMVSALNMDYMDALQAELEHNKLVMGVYALIKRGKVRQQLEALGYRTVAFDSGYEWSRLYDADAYLGLNRDTFAMQTMSRFEALLVKSTLLRVYTDYAIRESQSGLAQANSPFQEHIELERFILARLPDLAADPSPKFVFAHILIPHWPYVFLPNGSIRSDPEFDQDAPTPEQLRQGYTDSVAFVSDQIAADVERILAESQTPPVIVIFGDHGLKADNRLQNFAAIYLPEGTDGLYDIITPANYFRVIFNQVFDADYDLLPDLSYDDVDPTDAQDMRIFPETAPHCPPNQP
jgi:hypothetical protein